MTFGSEIMLENSDIFDLIRSKMFLWLINEFLGCNESSSYA
jgi:hypothetical protein